MNTVDKFIESKLKKKTPQFLYKYRSLESEFAEIELKNGYLYFSDWSKFNDPFEGKISLERSYSQEELFRFFGSLNKGRGSIFSDTQLRELAEKISKDKSCFIPILKSLLELMHRKIGVCCFTKKNDSNLMWSHYADSHKGICLEFDTRQDPQVFYPILEIQYIKDLLPFNFLDDLKAVQYLNLISQKSEGWKYEEEYRVYKHEFLTREFYYKPTALKSVIFGCKSTEETVQKVKKLLRNKPYVSYKKCEQDNNSYKLNIVDC